jgi:hypothetical protein
MEMYVGDRCRFYDARIEEVVYCVIRDITITPFPSKGNMDHTEVIITVATRWGDMELLSTEWHLNNIDFRITFSDHLRAKAA